MADNCNILTLDVKELKTQKHIDDIGEKIFEHNNIDMVLLLLFLLRKNDSIIECVLNDKQYITKFGLKTLELEQINRLSYSTILLDKFLNNDTISRDFKIKFLKKTFSGEKTIIRHLTIFEDFVDNMEHIIKMNFDNDELFLYLEKLQNYDTFNKDLITETSFIIYIIPLPSNEFIKKTKIETIFQYLNLLLENKDENNIEKIKKYIKTNIYNNIKNNNMKNTLTKIFQYRNLSYLNDLNETIFNELNNNNNHCSTDLFEDNEQCIGFVKDGCCNDAKTCETCTDFYIEKGACFCTEKEKSINYKQKYLKYKKKYIELKKII
jgi:hypothetical protein